MPRISVTSHYGALALSPYSRHAIGMRDVLSALHDTLLRNAGGGLEGRMRAPANAGKGAAGQSFVKGQFEELDWGANVNAEHDLGTDLWLMARDERRFDLRELVGAQVKSGPSYFESPEYEGGELVGWWYAERDDSHFDYWCDHSVPHLLVLHDLDTHTSYWTHVTREKLKSTGKGRKILVPRATTVGRPHFDELVRVATSRQPTRQWEGSAWDGASSLPAKALLRYALVTPRLVAPHPNKGTKEIAAHEAIAMLAQMRLPDLQRNGGDEGVDVDVARSSEAWEWRLFAALHEWVTEGTLSELRGVAGEADAPHRKAAATVCVAVALLEDGQPASAVEQLRRELDADEADPSDHLWLLAQLSQCLLELGDLAGARGAALDVQASHRPGLADPTAAAFAASAGNAVFSLGMWDEPTLAGAIRSGDTPSSWWRSQTMASGLAHHFDETFKTWVGDTSTAFASGDRAWLNLRSAMLLAGYAADRPGWRFAGSRLARRQLMTTTNPDAIATSLDLLRLSGENKLLGQVVTRLLRLGPVEPLTRIASHLDLTRSTRTSLHADIEFVQFAADIVPSNDGLRLLDWALTTLADPSELIGRLSPTFLVKHEVLGMARSLVRTVNREQRRRVVEHLLTLPAQEDQLVAKGYGTLLTAIPEDDWLPGDIERLRERPGADNWELTDDVTTVLARADSTFRAGLAPRIASGDLSALLSYGKVTDLEQGVAAAAIQSIGRAVREQVDSARRGTYALGAYDQLDALALLNAWHPDVSDWEPVLEILSFPASHAEHIGGGIRRLGATADQIPIAVRQRLRPHLRRLARKSASDDVNLFRPSVDIRSASEITLALFFPDEVSEAAILELLRGDAALRVSAVEIVSARGRESELALLALLTNDADVDVRAAAMEGLASWVVSGTARAEALEILGQALHETGPHFALPVSSALFLPSGDKAGIELLAGILADHPSATVRERVARATA